MEYDSFIKKLYDMFGIDLTYYKRSQMERRMHNLMRYEGCCDYDAYLKVLMADKSKLDKLVDHLTVNFSEFFRDPVQWEMLEKDIIPELYKGNRRLRIWSAGCAAGEEPYTLAMILSDLGIIEATLIAGDIDANALKKARRGVYTDKAIKNVTDDRLRKYFNKSDNLYQIKDHLKTAISFKRHDLIRDLPPGGGDFDLMVCRNVVIYFTEEAKRVFYQRVVRSLRMGGYLFTGITEQIFSPDKIGLALAGGQFIYQKIG